MHIICQLYEGAVDGRHGVRPRSAALFREARRFMCDHTCSMPRHATQAYYGLPTPSRAEGLQSCTGGLTPGAHLPPQGSRGFYHFKTRHNMLQQNTRSMVQASESQGKCARQTTGDPQPRLVSQRTPEAANDATLRNTEVAGIARPTSPSGRMRGA